MKVKPSWLIMLVALISVAGVIAPRLKYWFPSSGPAASEPAREEQATPEATVTAMFQATDQGSDLDNPNQLLTDRLDYAHLFTGKEMTPEEQKFVSLFWENQRSAAIYAYLRRGLTTAASITSNNTTADSAVVTAAVRIQPKDSTDWVDATYTLELKKRGPNWYVDELKSTKLPAGVYQTFRQRMGNTPLGIGQH
jgi:hypothetical protein